MIPYDKYKTIPPNVVPIKMIEIGMKVLLKLDIPIEGFRNEKEREWMNKMAGKEVKVTYASLRDRKVFMLNDYLYCDHTYLIDDIVEPINASKTKNGF